MALPPLSPEELAEAGLEHRHLPSQGHPRLLAATLAAGDRAQVLASLADILLARCWAEARRPTPCWSAPQRRTSPLTLPY